MLPVELYPRVMQALEYVGQGHTMTAACDHAGISVSSFRKCVTSQEELAEVLNDAQQRGYDAMAELLVNIDRDPRQGRPDAKMAAVVSKNIQWFLARARPEKYGNTVIVENRFTADKAITNALGRARERAEGAAKLITSAVIEDVGYAVIEEAVTVSEEDAAWIAVGLKPPR